MNRLATWIKHGDEIRRPLLVNPKLAKSDKIVIVGAGLSGLACAYRISEIRPDIEIILVEKSGTLGGVISTWHDDGWICDLAVNAVRPHPAFWRLIEDLQLAKKFKPTNSDATARWVITNGKKHKLGKNMIFKLNPLKLIQNIRKSRDGGLSVAQIIPNKAIADAFTLGIVNDTSDNVDADLLIPSITKFGDNPPVSKRKLKRMMRDTYPIFKPTKRGLASIEGGMKTLNDALVGELNRKPNVEIITNFDAESPLSISEKFSIPTESVIWTCPGWQDDYDQTTLSIFAIGYDKETVSDIPKGYGTLIPDDNIPVSGILHESDIHHSKRCPDGMRLFRVMVPHRRWDMDEMSIKLCVERLFNAKDPLLFKNLGEKHIPSFKPGHLSKMKRLAHDCSYTGWSVSGVSITHIVDQAERIAELFQR